MDIYFTRLKVIATLSVLGIGIVSTTKYQHECHPVYLKHLEDATASFYGFLDSW